MASFRDLEQKWWAKVGALMELQWWRRKGEKATWGRGKSFCTFGWVSEERENVALCFKKRLFSFFFLKAVPHVFFWVEQKGVHFFSWCDSYSVTRREKSDLFEMLKSRLGLRTISLVPVPRVSLHPSGPVFESKQYTHQNAQNKTPSVVQRLVLLNFKLHAKWWSLD